jgi:hypothetical protein
MPGGIRGYPVPGGCRRTWSCRLAESQELRGQNMIMSSAGLRSEEDCDGEDQ